MKDPSNCVENRIGPDPSETFLVGRGVKRGYSTLLAPSTMSSADAVAIAGELPTSDTAKTIRITLPDLGSVIVAYRSDIVTGEDIGNPSAQPLDAHGRPMRITYGTVGSVDATVDKLALAAAKDEALKTYARFLEDEECWPTPARSEPKQFGEPHIRREFPVVKPPLPIHPPPIPPVRWSRRDLLIGICIGIVIGIAVAATFWYFIIRPDGPRVSYPPPTTSGAL